MPIAQKLKPLTDSILTALIAARTDLQPANESDAGTMPTKALMAKVGEPDLTKMRAALKALVAEGLVYKLGNTRSTVFKAVLLTDDGDQGDAMHVDQDTAVAA